LAYKEDFLHLPLVNIWLEDFRRLLNERFAGISLPAPNFQFKATYDIDLAWSFRHKGFRRSAGALMRLFFTGKWKGLMHRVRVIRGRREDPFDAYEWMDGLHQHYRLQPLYFFLVAQQLGKYDRNTEIANPAFQDLIQQTATTYQVGLHPSWASNDHQGYLGKEKAWLEKIVNHNITASRQHYLRFELPATYRKLINAGITDEYSMGYGTINGFRASLATSFFWYDLKNESKTALRIHPFCFMDANAYYEEGKSAEETLQQLQAFFHTIQSVNGTMITIWHNCFLGTDEAFDGWREMYERFLSLVVNR
ncbi:MAG TPA: polysaccharide deacetylase family protein, partial [Flavisolibacter sp.]|nr:polysaccharide deacetylase family protein [Flavisolibacter sp.]